MQDKARVLARYEHGTPALERTSRVGLSALLGLASGIGPSRRLRVHFGPDSDIGIQVKTPAHIHEDGFYWQLRCESFQSEPEPVEVGYPKVFSLGGRFAEVSDALVKTRTSNMITPRGILFPEIEDVPEWTVPAREWSPWDLHRYSFNGGHISVTQDDSKWQWCDWTGRPSDVEIRSAIPLFEVVDFHYGHWLMDVLHRVLAVRDLDDSIPFLLGESTPRNIEWWLGKLNPDRPIIRVPDDSVVAIKEAMLPLQRAFLWRNTPYNSDHSVVIPGKFDPCAFGEIHKLVAPVKAHEPRNRRVWLRRDKARDGHLVNEADLAHYASIKWGFESLYPEDLPMSSLAEILSSCEFVISPTGSHLSNLMAAPSGVKILVLNGTTDYIAMTSGGFPRFFMEMGHDSALLLGPTIDPEAEYDYAPFSLSTAQLSFAYDWLSSR